MVTHMLEFRVFFLNGEYHGREWPPSPARLFQALIAGSRYRYRRGSDWSEEFDKALQWLEKQRPPIIVAPPIIRGCRYAAFRPANNIQKELEKEGQKLQQSMIHYYIQGPVRYIYDVDEAPYNALLRIARSVVSLGHSTDLVSLDLLQISDMKSYILGEQVYYPLQHTTRGISYGGSNVESLQIPLPGWYSRLESNFEKWYMYDESQPNKAQATLPPSYRGIEYAPVRNSSIYWVFRLEGPDGRRFSYPQEALVHVSAWVRHATGEVVKGQVDEELLKEFVFGHANKGAADNRLSYIPLPSSGSEHADARIRRVMVAALRGSLPQGLGNLGEKLDQEYLYDLNGTNKARLILIERPEKDGVSAAYTTRSDTWSTVTPVILHGHNFRNGKPDLKRTEKLLIEMFEQSGYRQLITSIQYGKLPFNPWGRHVKEYIVPEHLKTWPRYHVRVRFSKEIKGPILAGIGKHYGLGLFVRSTGTSGPTTLV